jgi:hypothetical protein
LFLQDARNDRHAPRARTDARGHFDLYVGWYRPGGALEISAPGYAALETNLGPRRLGVREVSRNYDLEPMAASAETATIDATPMPVPPVVVSSLPRAGTGNVDPALRLLRITFSKPIREGGANCTPFTGAAFPESAGQPRLEDGGRTWALPVRLQPGKVYGLWVNENDANFVGREGLPAVSYLLIFETRKSQ